MDEAIAVHGTPAATFGPDSPKTSQLSAVITGVWLFYCVSFLVQSRNSVLAVLRLPPRFAVKCDPIDPELAVQISISSLSTRT